MTASLIIPVLCYYVLRQISFVHVFQQHPDGKEMQINLTGFLNAKNARVFMHELWELLISAMDNIGGIPAKFLEQKKEEIKKRQVIDNWLQNQCLAC